MSSKFQSGLVSAVEVLSFQLLFVAVLASTVSLIQSERFVGAMVWGSLAHILPNFWVALRLFKKRVYDPKLFLRRFYVAEATKTVMTAALVLSLGWVLYTPAVWLGFAMAQLGTWLALPFVGMTKRKRFPLPRE